MAASKKAKVVLDEAAKLSPAEPMAQLATVPNWANWMTLRSIWASPMNLGDAKQTKLMALDDEDLKPLWEAG